MLRGGSDKESHFGDVGVGFSEEDPGSITIKSVNFELDRVKSRMVSFKRIDFDNSKASDCSNSLFLEETVSLKKRRPKRLKLERTVSYKSLVSNGEKNAYSKAKDDESLLQESNPAISLAELEILFSPTRQSELDAAAIRLQKAYKSYQTRRNLADCAVVVEELWWKALDFAALKQSSVSFFNIEKPESAASRWARARTRAAKVGKGLSKDEKAQKLALRHWLEAIDPRHRYGHNLHLYYEVWFNCQSSQPFFYWLDVGDGKEINLDKCQRSVLQRECIKYLGPKEREAYEVIIDSGKLVYKLSGALLDTIDEGSKWIFVLSTMRILYVGQKKKGQFQHSSFLSGGATIASGRLVARNGLLEATWPYSGHYRPTEENFMEFISFLEEHNVDFSNVKRFAIDDDVPSVKATTIDGEAKPRAARSSHTTPSTNTESTETNKLMTKADTSREKVEALVSKLGKRISLSPKWTTGAGPRIGCVREYPPQLQFQALEQVNLSPLKPGPGPTSSSNRPIPSPRPTPKVHLSPRLTANMGLPSPRVVHVPPAAN